MKLLSIDETLHYDHLDITTLPLAALSTTSLEPYSYLIVHGGDGSLRRVIQALQPHENIPPIILHATGSFNLLSKWYRLSKCSTILHKLAHQETLETRILPYYTLNKEIFLFSAGNMGDLQHIVVSETLRFGLLKEGVLKYLLTFFFLVPLHLMMTPFMLLSPQRFFIFTPFSWIKKFGSFYGEVKEMHIDLKNNYNHVELDGDVVTITEPILHIQPHKTFRIVC